MTALSQSILWQQMQTYYDEMGPEIWEDEVVPSQITSNTYLANLYTNLIMAQINDYRASCATLDPSLKPEPFYIIEIGAGHGKFSFYMLKALIDVLAIYNLPPTTICYVMTDISQKSLHYWNQHPALQAFIKNQTLDFALYNVLKDDKINLELSKTTIVKKQLTKPLFIVCNYIFDTLPHDAFQTINGKLYESELVISAQNKDNIERIFENNQYNFKQNAISGDYYKDHNDLNAILKNYMQHFEEGSFLIPIGAIQAIEHFTQLTQSATMVLAADKGTSALSLYEGLDIPEISYHGSVSMMVNFNALSQYTRHNQGISLLMEDQSADFQVANFIYNASYPISHTQHAFKTSFSAFTPQDLFTLFYKDDEPNAALTSLDEMLAIMNLSDWDPTLFYNYYPPMLAQIEKISDSDLTVSHTLAIKHGVDKVWSRFFKLEKTQDTPYAIAALLYGIDELEKAIEFYQYSLEQFGEREETFYNIAIAYQVLEDNSNAILYAQKSLQANPKYKEAKHLMNELKAEAIA